jgi:hypothetical protein
MSYQLEGLFIAPPERHEAGTLPASSLGSVTLAAVIAVETLAGIVRR